MPFKHCHVTDLSQIPRPGMDGPRQRLLQDQRPGGDQHRVREAIDSPLSRQFVEFQRIGIRREREQVDEVENSPKRKLDPGVGGDSKSVMSRGKGE